MAVVVGEPRNSPLPQKGGDGAWRLSHWQWGVLGLLILLSIGAFYSGVAYMARAWESPEYSHGYLIPLITLYLIWQKRERLAQVPFHTSWPGVAMVLVGVLLGFLGELSSLYTIIQYGFLLAIWGSVLAVIGREAFREVWVPLLFLFFMIPLPNFIYNNLSAELQLISSQLGVAVIRAFDISVYLQGNVIDLGTYQLQVVDACAGLRYLFPLMSLSFLCAYLFRAPMWQRVVLFLSSIPITILMNSFRIGVIGVLVENWGSDMAEGFLHDFEGWVVFMACFAVLLGEIWLFTFFGKPRRGMREAFGFDALSAAPVLRADRRMRAMPVSAVAAGSLLLVGLAGAAVLDERQELLPSRHDFYEFPMVMAEWQGRVEHMAQKYIDALKFDDYVMANYGNNNHDLVNFYVAYYGSQRKGQSAHSPRSCIPGDGWVIKSLEQRIVNGVAIGGVALRVNRVLIEKGDSRQLVYYWFQQRGRVITNEYLVKWYLFWDSLTRNRSDGALVRLTTTFDAVEGTAQADARLQRFAADVAGELGKYVPG